MNEYAGLLERGLKGGRKARTAYERERPLRYPEMEGWVKRGYDGKVAAANNLLFEALQERTLRIATDKALKDKNRQFATQIGEILKKIMDYKSIERAAKALAETESKPSVVNMPNDPFRHAPVIDEHFKRTLRELTAYAAKATALADFLQAHPAQLGEKDKIRIADELESHWKLKEHETISRILEAEAELSELFELHQASEEDRRLAVKWRAVDDKPKTLDEIETRLWGVKPKPKPEEGQTHAEPAKEAEIASLGRRYPGLSRETLRKMANLIIHLQDRGIQSAEKTMETLSEYEGSDPHGFLKALHDEATRKPENNLSIATEEVQLPNEGKGEQDENGFDEGGAKIETPDQLLNRLKPSKAKMTYPDHTTLSKMIRGGQIPPGRLKEAIAHEVLFRVANHVKGSGTHAANIKGIAGRFPLDYQAKANQVMHWLINQKQLSGVKGSQTIENEALTLARGLRAKYYDRKIYAK